jgi:hypothetical protein
MCVPVDKLSETISPVCNIGWILTQKACLMYVETKMYSCCKLGFPCGNGPNVLWDLIILPLIFTGCCCCCKPKKGFKSCGRKLKQKCEDCGLLEKAEQHGLLDEQMMMNMDDMLYDDEEDEEEGDEEDEEEEA